MKLECRVYPDDTKYEGNSMQDQMYQFLQFLPQGKSFISNNGCIKRKWEDEENIIKAIQYPKKKKEEEEEGEYLS